MRSFFIISLLLVLPLFILSQEQRQYPKDSLQNLDELVVIAQKQIRNKLLVPYNVNSIGIKEMNAHQFRTVPEALSGINGVFLQKTNHGGGAPIINGMMGNQILVLVDGIRLNNSTFRYGPNQYSNTIDVFTVQKIEVAKGTGAVQYGTDAMGGVINIVTKDPTFSTSKPIFSGSAIAKIVSSAMEQSLRTEAGWANQKIALSAGFTKRNFGDLIGGANTGKQSPTGYKEWATDFKAKVLLKQNIVLTFSHNYLQQQNVPVYHKVQLENYFINEMNPQQHSLTFLRFVANSNNKWIKEKSITLSYQKAVEGRSSIKNGSTIFRNERDEVKTVGLTTDFFTGWGKVWTANSGIEAYWDKVFSTREDINSISHESISKRGLYPDQSKYNNYSIYSLHHFNVRNWIFDAGLRFNKFNAVIKDSLLGKLNYHPSAFVANFAILKKIGKNQSVYVSFSNGFRAPNIDDMGSLGIVDFRYETPAFNLRPEKSRNVELGYKLQSKKIAATISIYHLQLLDLVTRIKLEGQIMNGYPVYKKENTSSAYVNGLETSINWVINKNITCNSMLAYTYGQNITLKEPLRRIPPLNGKISSAYNKNIWSVGAVFQFASRQTRLAQGDKEDNRIGPNGTAGWKSLNLFGTATYKQIQIAASLNNLFNENYRTHGSGINEMGRSLSVTVGIKL